jgi:hypothetical protein
MADSGVDVLGIPIPSSDPVFLAILAVHVTSGLVAVVAGVVAMLARKAAGRHPRAGTVYYVALVVTWLTAMILTVFRPVENWPLAVVGSAALLAATIGRAAHRRHWTSWAHVHVVGMGMSYILMLTAFYIDNGPHLVGWRELPTWTHWVVSSVVGVPLIVRTLLRNPIVVAERRGRP